MDAAVITKYGFYNLYKLILGLKGPEYFNADQSLTKMREIAKSKV